MKKFILAAAAALAISANLLAGNTNNRNLYQQASFKDCWFVSAGAGYGLALENGHSYGNLTADAYIGKWLTPSIGLRAGYKGINLTSRQDLITGHTPKIDFVWNASATIAGYNPKRIVEVYPYIGGGVILSSFRGVKNAELMANAGVIADFQVARNLSVDIDLCLAGARAEAWYNSGSVILLPSVTAGISYAFGRHTTFQKHECPTFDDSAYRQQIAELQDSLANTRQRLSDALAQRREVHDTVAVHIPQEFAIRVNFSLDSDRLTDAEKYNLEFLLAQLPSDCQMTIEGHADYDTGNPAYNQKLSQRRIDSVRNYLRRLGFRDTVAEYPKGDTANRFNDPDGKHSPERNRVCVIKFKL